MSYSENDIARIEYQRRVRDCIKRYERETLELNLNYDRNHEDMRKIGSNAQEFLASMNAYQKNRHELYLEFEKAKKQALFDFQKSMNLPAPTIPIISEYDIFVEEAGNMVAQARDIEL